MLVIYIILVAGAIFGATQVEIDFKVTYFIGETSKVYEYFNLNEKYFNTGTSTVTYIDNSSLDYSSTEVQKQIIAFDDNLEACTDCDEDWHLPNTLRSWYKDFNEWTKDGNCLSVTASTDVAFTVPQAQFYSCLTIFLQREGARHIKDLRFTGDLNGQFELTGWRQEIRIKKITQIAT